MTPEHRPQTAVLFQNDGRRRRGRRRCCGSRRRGRRRCCGSRRRRRRTKRSH